MTVGLAMIVRDAEADIEACLASVAGLVDEMVVADTGSSDDTRGRARARGARVFEIPWEEDFARARNLVLAEARCDWVLALDADERLEAGDPAGWRAQLGGNADAFQITIRNYVRSPGARVWDRPARPNREKDFAGCPEAAEYPAYVEHQNVRLFRRCPELYFVGRVHESVGPRVAARGLRLGTGQGLIHHFGLALAPAGQAAKNHRYRELARRKVEEQPLDAQAHFELGLMEFDNFHRDGVALGCFERSLRLRPEFALGWFYGGAALLRLGHAVEAQAFFAQAAERGYASPLLSEMQGDAHYNGEHFAEAAAGYRAAMRQAGIGDAAAGELASKLGLAELRAGDRGAGMRHLRQGLARAPELEGNHDRLVAACVWLEDWNAAAAAQRARVERFPEQTASHQRLAALERRAAIKAGEEQRR